MNQTRNVTTKYEFQIQKEKLDALGKQIDSITKSLNTLTFVEVGKFFLDATAKAFEFGKAAFEGLERTAELGEKIHVAAESAGITAEAFQKLAFSAKENSVSGEEMEHGMVRLSRALYAARTGGAEAQKAFALAGISPDQVMGFRTSQDALLALADQFKNNSNSIEKQAQAQALLGRGSLHMVGWLSQGSNAIRQQGIEAQKAGAILTTAQTNTLVKLFHELTKVTEVVTALSAKFAVQFAPSVQMIAEDFLKFIEALKGLYGTKAGNWLDDMLYGLGYLYGWIKIITKEFLGMGKMGFGNSILEFLDRFREKILNMVGLPKFTWLVDKLSTIGGAAVGLAGTGAGNQELRTALTMQKIYGTPLTSQQSNLLAQKEMETPGFTQKLEASINVSVSMNLPTGTTAAQAGDQIGDHINRALDNHNRNTQAGVARTRKY